MRRFWIGIVILTVTLALGITVSALMPGLHKPIEQHLRSAVSAAQEEDWATAEKLTEEAARRWERCRSFTASVADHAPMESIDSGFAQVLAFLQQRDTEEFAAACAFLARSVQAMADSHSIVWWNFL